MNTGIYAGSFDPFTLGHLDIVERSSRVFERLVISVIENLDKNTLFSLEERVFLIKEAVAHLENVSVESSKGLLADYAKKFEKPVIIKGLRNSTDLEYESPMAYYNRELNPSLETFFIMANPSFTYLSSSAMRTLAMYGGDCSKYLPFNVSKALYEKLKAKS